MFESLDQLLVVLDAHVVDHINQTLQVAHAEQLLHKRLRFEELEVVDVLSGTDKHHRGTSHRHTETRNR